MPGRSIRFLLRLGMFAIRLLSEVSKFYCMYGNVPVVKISQGLLAGTECYSRSGMPYYAFYGIPYVDRPVRFQPPSFNAPRKWTGVWDASYHRPACLQYDGTRLFGHEDCLYLNVFTPRLNGSLPVIVFIHGGSFQVDAGHAYGGKYFMDEQVVLVTFNYRLGALGFLSTGDGVLSGNMGLKDQVAALKWVRRNIERFGGNPEIITVFGEDAGAVSASLHMLSPMSRGLIRSVITSSGAALNPWSCLKKPRMNAQRLARRLCCPYDDSRSLLNCLQYKDANSIVMETQKKWSNLDPLVPFGPVIEYNQDYQCRPQQFLSESPYEIIQSGNFARIPWMAGFVQDDGLYTRAATILKSPSLLSDLNTNWTGVGPITLMYDEENASPLELSTISSKIRKFYFENRVIREENPQPLIDLYTDRLVIHGVRTMGVLQAQQGGQVYPFIFAYNGSYSFLQQKGFYRGYGVSHKDELQYLFDGIAPELQPGLDDQLSRNLVKLWACFAATGRPLRTWGYVRQWNPISLSEAYGKSSLKFYRIDVDPRMIPEPFTARMAFWDQLMIEHEPASFPRRRQQNTAPDQLPLFFK